MTLVSKEKTLLPGAHPSTLKLVEKKIESHGIKVVYGSPVASIDPSGVKLADGQLLECNVPIWATGAEAQPVSAESDLELMKGYFRVNDCL